jgi:Na+-driven multidrug efflux pump
MDLKAEMEAKLEIKREAMSWRAALHALSKFTFPILVTAIIQEVAYALPFFFLGRLEDEAFIGAATLGGSNPDYIRNTDSNPTLIPNP